MSTWMPLPSPAQLEEEAKQLRQEKGQEMRKYLLMQIEEYPALWQHSHPLFKEKSTVHREAWQQILSLMKKKYEEALIEHHLSTVQELMAAFKTLKAGLRQADKSQKKSTGMAASAVKPVTWPFYQAMQFIKESSEPLATESSLQLLDSELTGEPSASAKWDPDAASRRRSNKSRNKHQLAATKEEETHEATLSTLSAARDTLDSLKKSKEEKRRKKEKPAEDDEAGTFLAYLGTQIRQVYNCFPL